VDPRSDRTDGNTSPRKRRWLQQALPILLLYSYIASLESSKLEGKMRGLNPGWNIKENFIRPFLFLPGDND